MRQEHSIHFPSQAVSDLEKLSEDYGLKVARAIRHEWFSGTTSKYNSHKNNFHSIHFPSQAVSDLEKLSEDYGLKVADRDWETTHVL